MNRILMLLLGLAFVGAAAFARADIVTDWNATFRSAAQRDGADVINYANPGWSTRAIAITNGAIYDIFQSFNPTYKPFMVNTQAPSGASMDAAINQAAYETLVMSYPNEHTMITADYRKRMDLIPNSAAKTLGMQFGHSVASAYLVNREDDHASDSTPYTPGTLPGQWRPDPYHPTQKAWGPGWGTVTPFAIGSTAQFVNALTPPPALNSPEYTAAYNQVKSYGALNSTTRTAEQTEESLFWAYDRGTMGPPPVMFDRNLEDIGTQVGNSPAQNARMFAMASVAMADASTAAWDAKFAKNYWRPVTAIHEAGNDGSGFDDGNPNTVGDVNWRPLGAPGPDPNSTADDFTPPFPSWTSGHATMGSAMYQSLELFFGTNNFTVAAANNGVTSANGKFTLHSDEFDANGVAGMTRQFSTFIQTGNPQDMDLGMENSPEGENFASRVYLGVHWIFDQRDGMELGRNIADYIFANDFKSLAPAQNIPEPATITLMLVAASLAGLRKRRRPLR
jgi:hypothetical protein